MVNRINVGRKGSGGVFDGLFGNPIIERRVSEFYRTHIRRVLKAHPEKHQWLKEQLANGAELYCPGCGVGAPHCHARILEQEL